MDVKKVDWNALWGEVSDNNAFGKQARYSDDFWNNKSNHYNQADYGEAQRVKDVISIMKVDKNTSLLDIGCGTGKITVPLAQAAKKVTALDRSAGMLERLQEAARSAGVKNITCVNKKWEDAEINKDVEPHDIVMASYSLVMRDIKGALLKMNEAAKRGVFLAWWAGKHTMGFEKFWERIGRTEYRAPADYIYLINILHDEGINANVRTFDHTAEHTYNSFDDAVRQWQGNYGLTAEKDIDALKKYLKEISFSRDGLLVSHHPIHTAFVWWFKQ